MSLNRVFTNHLPKLDLHGEIGDTARVMINDYIEECFKLKINTFIIIHGIGTGVLKKVTRETLLRNKKVLEFGIDFMNQGSTIVRLKN